MSNPNKLAINKDTLVPLGFVVTVCAAAIWLNTQLNSINHKLDMLESNFSDQWTKRDMENWALKFKLENPNIILPEVTKD